MTDTTTPVESSTMRVTPSQARSNARVDSILAAAKEHLAEVGRDRFRLGPVHQKAGCSVGTLYRYFEDRVALLNAIDPEGVTEPAVSVVAPDDYEKLKAGVLELKDWCERMVIQGQGKGDLKVAGSAFLKLMNEKGML